MAGFIRLYCQPVMFPAWSTLLGFFIGASVGSFLNVVIHRLPKGMSLSHPPSHCPNCDHRLGVLDLFPILSFLLSGAKCRYCKAGISWRYFWVEAFTGLLWGAFWYQMLVAGEDPVRFVLLAVFASVLVAVIFIDIFHFIIPDSLNAWLLAIGLGYNGWQITQGLPSAWIEVGGVSLPSSVVGALVGAGSLWGIAFFGRIAFRKDSMGHGDIKLARGVGAVLLPQAALLSFGLAVAAGAVFGVVQWLFRRKEVARLESEEGVHEREFEPESIGSLLRCGLGYALALDVPAMFSPKLDRAVFGEDPNSDEAAEDEWEPGATTIPFGPYLAVGALMAALFEGALLRIVADYWGYATRG